MCFIICDSYDGNGKVNGGLAGTPASMCSVYGTVIRGLQICSEWLCLRGGKYLCCNFLTHLTDSQAKCMLLFPGKKK